MLFEKKKIDIETLSEYLSEVRAKLSLSAEEVCQKAGISPKFLAALEGGNFKILPADVYVYGFLKKLAVLYYIDAEVLIEQFKKERGILQHLSKKPQSFNATGYKKYFGKLVITPKVISFVLGLAFIALSVGYIVWQVWSINKIPSLEIYQPSDNSVINGSFVEVEGKTDPGMDVSVNGLAIFVDNNGAFQTQLALVPGATQITITAKNRFSKTFSKTISLTGQPPLSTTTPLQLELKTDFSAPVSLTFVLDSQAPQTMSFNAGDSKIFLAKQEILLSTSDAGATKITLNGQVLGPMGRSKEVLNNVSFFSQAGNVPTTTPTGK